MNFRFQWRSRRLLRPVLDFARDLASVHCSPPAAECLVRAGHSRELAVFGGGVAVEDGWCPFICPLSPRSRGPVKQ